MLLCESQENARLLREESMKDNTEIVCLRDVARLQEENKSLKKGRESWKRPRDGGEQDAGRGDTKRGRGLGWWSAVTAQLQ